jgi:hypothetical protein
VAGELERNGFALEPFQPFLAGLARLKDARPTPADEGIEYLAASPLRGVVDRHLVQDGHGWHLLVYLHYSGKEFSQKDFLRDLAVQDPAARATSIDMVSSQLAESVKHSFLWGFLLGGTLVLCLLLAHFKSLSGIFASLFPVLSGVVVMTGMMAITGMGLNFMNAMVLVTILGMGSDYGLHIAHRVGGARIEGQKTEYVQAGRAVLLSALTTIAGFGSLAFTDYGAMSSIGWATNYYQQQPCSPWFSCRRSPGVPPEEETPGYSSYLFQINRSRDHCPPPATTRARAIPKSAKVYSMPFPLALRKKPLTQWTLYMATAIVTAMPQAESRVKAPHRTPSPPPNSAIMASSVSRGGIPRWTSKCRRVPVRPAPPNSPSSFWEP